MRGKGGLVIAIAVLACVAAAVRAQEKPEREVSDKLIGKIDVREVIGRSITVSPDAKHFAYVASSGCTQWVVVDGNKGEKYGMITGLLGGDDSTVSFSPDGKHVAYSAYKRGPEYWYGWEKEPTSGKMVYMTKRWGEMCVVVDGKEGEKYDIVKCVTFSPDSKRIAYVAGRGGKEFAVVDDKEEKQQYDSVSWPVFSPDGKRLAYQASVERKEGPLTTTEHFVVVDGKEGEHYSDVAVLILSIVFSPNSKRVAYSLWKVGLDRRFMVVDGIREKEYKDVGLTPVFSPDSKHIAYGARKSDTGSFKSFIVLDGKEQNLYDDVDFDEIVFSPDSKRLAYKASAERKWFVVVDGKEEKRYDEVWWICFSPDSKRLAYRACADENDLVVVDGDEGKRYEAAVFPVFSPDSKGVAYLAKRGDKWFVVVNGKEGKQYHDILCEVTFDSDTALHYLALSDNTVYLVEERLK
jgi:Tol biopolymer transport system component